MVTVLVASGERNDMDIFLQASQGILAGRNAYELRYNEWYRYFYSPLFALAVAPLGWLGPSGAKLLWGVLSIVLVLRCMAIVDRWLRLEEGRVAERARFHALLLLLLFQPVRDNINSNQLTPLLVWCMLEGIRLIRNGRGAWGGLLIAFGMDIKLLPIVLLPYLLWRKHWRGTIATLLFFVAMQFVPAFVLGWDQLLALDRTRAELLNPTDPRHILDEEEPSFIALGSLLSAYLSTEGGSSNTMSLPRNLAALSIEHIAFLLLIGRLALITLTLAFVRWPPFRGELDEHRVLREVGYLLLCTILLFPHQRNYSMLLAAPAIAYLLHARLHLISPNATTRWTVALVIAFLGLNAEMLLGEFADVYAHYKVKSFIVLGLIAMLVCAPTPQRETASIK
ncbi:MAG: glycosyltransferase family 87 protein [Flavobacteriales bacterium]